MQLETVLVTCADVNEKSSIVFNRRKTFVDGSWFYNCYNSNELHSINQPFEN